MTFLNVVAIESAIQALGATYPSAARVITLPYVTAEGRTSHALRITTDKCLRTGVLLVSGVHSREKGGPDILVNLAADLLEAWSVGTGLVYGGTSFSAAEIQRILERVELIVFPDVNPDGLHYAQTTYPDWRKNRNPVSSGGDPAKIGVDVNRNYDFMWDFPVYFAPAAITPGLASNDPASYQFHGRYAFSEAEAKNVHWLFDSHPRVRRFIDIHSYGGNILHPWGDDANQTSDPTRNFNNPAWHRKRGVNGDAYAEFISARSLVSIQTAGNAMKAAIAGVRGQSYSVAQSYFMPGWPGVYPTSGASDDWVYSRHYINPADPLILAYTIEFNTVWGQFAPTWTEMERMILDVDAGLVRFSLDAASPRPWWWWIPIFDLCWLRTKFWAIWKRVFPPELWGPYGPWTRIQGVLLAVLNPVIRKLKALIGPLLRR